MSYLNISKHKKKGIPLVYFPKGVPLFFDSWLFAALSSVVYWILELVHCFVHCSRSDYVIFRSGRVLNGILYLTPMFPTIGHLQYWYLPTSPWICPHVVKQYCEVQWLKSKCRWNVFAASSSEPLWQHPGRKGIVLPASCITRFSIASVANCLSGD